jgi:hypothetical protein
MALVRHQMRRIARGRQPALGTRPACALVSDQLVRRRALRRYRPWLRTRQPVPGSRRAMRRRFAERLD